MASSCTDADVRRNREANEALTRENDRLKVTSAGSAWLDSPSLGSPDPPLPRCPGERIGRPRFTKFKKSDLGVVRRSENLD